MGEQASDPTYIGFSCIAEQYQRKVRIANKLLAPDLNKSQMYPEQKIPNWMVARDVFSAVCLTAVKASRKLN